MPRMLFQVVFFHATVASKNGSSALPALLLQCVFRWTWSGSGFGSGFTRSTMRSLRLRVSPAVGLPIAVVHEQSLLCTHSLHSSSCTDWPAVSSLHIPYLLSAASGKWGQRIKQVVDASCQAFGL